MSKFAKFMLIIALVVFAVMLGFILFYRSKYHAAQDQVYVYKLDSQKTSIVINKKGLEVAQQSAIMQEQQEQLQGLYDSTFNLSRKYTRAIKDYVALITVHQQLRTSMKAAYVKIDTLPKGVVYQLGSVTSVVPGPRFTSDSLAVPQQFMYKDEKKQLYGTVTKHSVDIDSFLLNATISLAAVRVKNGMRVDAKGSDSTIHITGMTSLWLKEKKTDWNRWIKPALTFVAGVAATIYINKNLK